MKTIRVKTYKQAVYNSMKMWKWLYENPDKTKEDYELTKNISLIGIEKDCFLCDYFTNIEKIKVGYSEDRPQCKAKCVLRLKSLCHSSRRSAYNIWCDYHYSGCFTDITDITEIKAKRSAGKIYMALEKEYNKLKKIRSSSYEK